jgi:8-oxo-dGTP pyrophosphatase MutT (NUDIX family)
MNTSQIGCIVFRQKEKQKEFLLLKRIPEKTGFWQSITGEVENETLLEAVFREAKEEANISIRNNFGLQKTVNHLRAHI